VQYLHKPKNFCTNFIAREILVELPKIIEGETYLDPKSKLQEMVQEKSGITPHYGVVSESGPDHNKTFVVAAYVGEKEVGQGSGPSKQEAELAAAENALTEKKW
jgi:ribonuclease-3